MWLEIPMKFSNKKFFRSEFIFLNFFEYIIKTCVTFGINDVFLLANVIKSIETE